MITLENARDFVLQKSGRVTDLGPIAILLASVDQDQILVDERKNVRFELWDKESPINGVDAIHVLARNDYHGGEIYLIYIEDQLVILQPFNYQTADHEPLTLETAEIVARAHCEMLAQQRADNVVYAAIEAEIRRIERQRLSL